MILSALFMAILGVAASFFPQEILAYSGSQPGRLSALLIQISGAVYLGFASVNWTARANIIGGIYNRPVALGNFLHFTIATVALLKGLISGLNATEVVSGTIVYSVFSVWFGLVLFTHPSQVGESK